MMPSHHCTVYAARARHYEVRMTEAPLGQTPAPLVQTLEGRRALIVCSPTVSRLYGKALYRSLAAENPDVHFFVLHCSEAKKTVEQVVSVCDAAHKVGLDRKAVLVGLGGGVVLDIVTMAAAWIRRGIEHVRVPTTLIGQVDAGVGIKGAVNFGARKNYLGVFHPPSTVLIDPAFLYSLPRSHIRHGLAEIIKLGIVRDLSLFNLVERHASDFLFIPLSSQVQPVRELVWRSIAGMVEELRPNLYEDQTYERLVDFGHTFSPALEAAFHYSIHHGAAVAIDMALSATIAAEAGLLPLTVCERIIALLKQVGLPTWSPLLTPERCETALTDAARHRGGCVNLVIPIAVGRGDFLRDSAEISPSLLKRALEVLANSEGGRVLQQHSLRASWPRVRQVRL
jgi:3-dehydroquinate synthetase